MTALPPTRRNSPVMHSRPDMRMLKSHQADRLVALLDEIRAVYPSRGLDREPVGIAALDEVYLRIRPSGRDAVGNNAEFSYATGPITILGEIHHSGSIRYCVFESDDIGPFCADGGDVDPLECLDDGPLSGGAIWR